MSKKNDEIIIESSDKYDKHYLIEPCELCRNTRYLPFPDFNAIHNLNKIDLKNLPITNVVCHVCRPKGDPIWHVNTFKEAFDKHGNTTDLDIIRYVARLNIIAHWGYGSQDYILRLYGIDEMIKPIDSAYLEWLNPSAPHKSIKQIIQEMRYATEMPN